MLWKRWIGNEVRVSHDLFIASKEMHKPSPAHRSGALRQPADEMVGIVRVLDGLNRLRLADDPDFCAAWKAAGSSGANASCVPCSTSSPPFSTSIRSAIRTVENRCEISTAILPLVSSEPEKHLVLGRKTSRYHFRQSWIHTSSD